MMQTRRWIGLFLLATCLALASTSQAAITWVCTKNFSSLERWGYLTIGTCAPVTNVTYTTGGDAMVVSQLCGTGFQSLVQVNFANDSGAVCQFVVSTGKLLCRGGAAAGSVLAELTAGTNLSTAVLPFTAYCK